MNKAFPVLTFVLGAAVGSVAAWQFAKKKYERIAQEEIDSVKKVFSRPKTSAEIEATDEPQPEPDCEPEASDKVSVREYAAKLREQGYTNYSDVEPKDPEPCSEPYVISPDEFGEKDGYSTLSLMYYQDQVLADDDDNVIHNVDDIVGWDSLTRFGEYEDDSVFVRNERLKIDYEILLSLKKYSEVLEEKPYKAEV